ncbi:MAG: acyl carrier protein [Burkholderiaceae bacterium]|jgi:acyl carrier protein|nr:acyl carrier protein [Burkholderiaceae bacterium]MCZ8176415.1 acyl carrier protein [Burkholderiaceae bacterium]
MTDHEIRALAAEVLAGIAPEADLAAVGDHEDLREALDLDSMDFLNFVIALGERTGRRIPEADTRRLFTLEGLLGYLRD